MKAKKNYISFIILELPNLFQLISIPALISFLFNSSIISYISIGILGLLVGLYLGAKEETYFKKKIGNLPRLIAAIFVSLLVTLVRIGIMVN